MSAKHALLGLLLEGPAYPYELGDRLQQRLGPAWEVKSGQLYQLVKGLEKDELIARVQHARPDREDRHVFAITDDGITEFERWFDETANRVRLCRRPLLVQITFAGQGRLRNALAKVDSYELECAERLKEIARLREALPADGRLIRADHLLLRLNLSADVYQLEGELRWARHAREMLSWLANREAVWPADRKRADVADVRHDHPSARRELFTRMAGDQYADAGAKALHKRSKDD
jgi:DNA-binding PadR family transcriptional regulator